MGIKNFKNFKHEIFSAINNHEEKERKIYILQL